MNWSLSLDAAALAEIHWLAMLLGCLFSASTAYCTYCLYLRYQMNRLNKELGALLFEEIQDEKCSLLSGRSHN